MKKNFEAMEIAMVGEIQNVVNQTVTITKLSGTGDEIASLRQTNQPFDP